MIAGGRGRLNSDIYSDNLRKVRLRGNCAMAVHKKGGALTEKEKSIVKSLLAEGCTTSIFELWQISAVTSTINGARITKVKQSDNIELATPDEVNSYKNTKEAYDWQTA